MSRSYLGGDIQIRETARQKLTRSGDRIHASGNVARVQTPDGLTVYRSVDRDTRTIVWGRDEAPDAVDRGGGMVDVLDVEIEKLGTLVGRKALQKIATLYDDHQLGKARSTFERFAHDGEGASAHDGKPVLVLLHGVLSSPAAAFQALRVNDGLRGLQRGLPSAGQKGHDVWAFGHRTLTLDPIENAAQLVRHLRKERRFHTNITILAHSRGGLVAELLARRHLTSAQRATWKATASAWAKNLPVGSALKFGGESPTRGSARKLIEDIVELDEQLLSIPKFSIRRLVRAGSPMLGSQMAGPAGRRVLERLLAIGKLILQAKTVAAPWLEPVVRSLEGFLIGVARAAFDDPSVLPGLRQIRRGGELPVLLSLAPRTSVPTVAIGAAWEPRGLPARIVFSFPKWTLERLHGGPNDVAVDVDSMRAATREPAALVDRVGPRPGVTHLDYFGFATPGTGVDEVLGAVLAEPLTSEDVQRVVDSYVTRSGSSGSRQLPTPRREPGRVQLKIALNPLFLESTTFPDPMALLASTLGGSATRSPAAARRDPHPPARAWLEGLVVSFRQRGVELERDIAPCNRSLALTLTRADGERIDVPMPKGAQSALKAALSRVPGLRDPESLAKAILQRGAKRPAAGSTFSPVTTDLLRALGTPSVVSGLAKWALGDQAPEGSIRVSFVADMAAMPSDPPTATELFYAALASQPQHDLVRPRSSLRVRHGSAHAFDGDVLLLPHYAGEPPSAMLRDLDERTENDIFAALASAGGMPAPRHVVSLNAVVSGRSVRWIVLGLDSADRATGGALSAVTANALRPLLVDRSSRRDHGPLQIGAMLPGQSSFEMLSTDDAVSAFVEGVMQALEDASSDTDFHLTFFERYEDLACRAGHAAHAVADSNDLAWSGLEQVNGHFGPRPTVPEVRGGWGRCRVIAAGNSLEVSIDDRGAGGTKAVSLAQPERLSGAAVGSGRLTPMLGPLATQLARTDGGIVLALDSVSARYAWELAATNIDGRDAPLALRRGVVRTLVDGGRPVEAPVVVDRRALVLGDPKDTGLPELRGSAAEAVAVSALLQAAGYEVDTFIRAEGEQTVRALFNRRYSILHLATHGTGTAGGRIMLGGGATLGVDDIRALRHVPAMVVLSACDTGWLAQDGAALVRELLARGTRMLIAAAWEVEDLAAKVFMTTLYGHLDRGVPFGRALLSARVTTHREHGNSDTWAAFQAYGDPDARLLRGRTGVATGATGSRARFVHSQEVVNEAITLLGEMQLKKPAHRAELIERARALREESKRIPDLDGAALDRLATVFMQLGEADDAIALFEGAMASRHARLDVVCRAARLRAREAWRHNQREKRGVALRALELMTQLTPTLTEAWAARLTESLRSAEKPDQVTAVWHELKSQRSAAGLPELAWNSLGFLGLEPWPDVPQRAGRAGSPGHEFFSRLREIDEAQDDATKRRLVRKCIVPRADLLAATAVYDLLIAKSVVSGAGLWRELAAHVESAYGRPLGRTTDGKP